MNNILQKSTNIHGSCVAINGQGVLLLGESGAGKSDLALRLLDRGAKLVSDDRVELHRIYTTEKYMIITTERGKLITN